MLPKILLCVSSTKLSYGGPAFSVTGLAEALVKADCRVGLWSPLMDESQVLNSPKGHDKSVFYLSGRLKDAMKTFGRPDIIHDNGIWLPNNHTVAAYSKERHIPRIVSPRGMLAPWAMRHKATKKKIAWFLYQKSDLLNAACLHATSTDERRHLEALNLNRQIHTIANGLRLTNPNPTMDKSTDLDSPDDLPKRIALFLGRIYPVKGLPNLISAWAEVRPQSWKLIIAGPDEAGHQAELRAQIQRLGLEKSVVFFGPVNGAKKIELLQRSHLFILPSLSESFGIAVAEAMAQGLPVITTHAAPWAVIKDYDLGWWVPASKEGLAEAVSAATNSPPADLKMMGFRGSEYVQAHLSWDKLVLQYIDMYASTLALRARF